MFVDFRKVGFLPVPRMKYRFKMEITSAIVVPILLFLSSDVFLPVVASTTARPTTTPEPTTTVAPDEGEYIVGVGIDDVTGPAADVNMMGYANPSQVTGGIHLRIFSRAFIFAHRDSPKKRAVFVNVECGMQGQGVTQQVLKNLKAKFGDLYNDQNVAISGTHTHSTPAGFLNYVLYDITSLGYVKETFDALVSGITMSIINADKRMEPAHIYISQRDLYNSSINRSPSAYEANPPHERLRYKHNVDTRMTLLKILHANTSQPMGMLNWFAVHGTSMNNTNRLISSDNKGYAALCVENHFNRNHSDSRPGKGPFVAAFAQSHLGDVSPNTNGAKCIDTGKPCERNSSTCGGKNENCIAFGPGRDMYESTKVIGGYQRDLAMDLWSDSTGKKLTGPISFIHQYVDMTNITVHYNSTFSGKTCKPAMGYSFAAGTTDGPGAFDFTQGTTSTNPFWNMIRDLLQKPSEELVQCQAPKPILLATGETDFPYAWSPSVVDTMILKIGQLVILPVPGEFTTMSGRRLMDIVQQALKPSDAEEENHFVIAGLSNTYSDYIATYEEYQVQRYEAASTIYGPHTLQAYLEQYEKLAKSLKKGSTLPKGPTPPDLLPQQWSFLPPVIYDEVPLFTNFGDVVKDVAGTPYTVGKDVVTVTFRAGNPRNNLRTGGTFLSVERKNTATGKFEEVYTDAHWSTRFMWKRTSTILGHSEATLRWEPELPGPQPGTFRIHYYGDYKRIDGEIVPFEGVSSEFKVVNPGYRETPQEQNALV